MLLLDYVVSHLSFNIEKFMKIKIYLLLLVFVSIIPFGCHKVEVLPTETKSLAHKAADYEGRMAHEWMELGYQIVKTNFLFGPHAARTYGYLGLTAWESVCNGVPNGKSMQGQINDYKAPNLDTDKEYDWGIVLCTSMKIVIPELIDNVSPSQRGEVEVLATLQENEMMSKGVSEEIRLNSRDFGLRLGTAIVNRIQSDGRDVIRNIVPVLPERDAEHPWYWVGPAAHPAPVEPMWGTLRTFAINSSQSCEAVAPLAYSAEPNSAFYKDAKEVYDNYPLSGPNKAIAYHWENGPGRTCSPACHWVNITEQLLKQANKDLAFSAKAYCLVGFAAADCFSAAWYMKYKFNLMRPITYIREAIDPNWTPALGTPPYPDYVSGSSTIGGAAPVVLSSIMPDEAFVDNTHLGSPLYTPDGGPWILPERSFASLTKAGEEQALSRILGGVHFRRACDEGLKSGRCIGNTIVSTLDFGF
jgi:PAP2 superfamily